MELNIDLQGLGELAEAEVGTPPQMPVERIRPDPHNRILREQDEQTPEGVAFQRELDADVGKVGIKSPLSLRPDPDLPDGWIINHGHNRYKAAINNNLKTVPYFVDRKFSDYDQVNENLKRRNLTPWAFAEFIKSRIGKGESKGEIAAGLGKSQNFVTEHLALVDAPECLHLAHDQGVKSPRTLYDLRRAYDEFPIAVTDWCRTGVPITRDTIQALLADLRRDAACDKAAQEAVDAQDQTAGLRHDVELAPEASAKERGTELRHDVKPELGLDKTDVPAPVRQVPAASARESAPKAGQGGLRHGVKTPATAAPLASANTFASPAAIMVEHEGRKAVIDPASTVMLRYSNGESAQVALSKVTVLPMVA